MLLCCYILQDTANDERRKNKIILEIAWINRFFFYIFGVEKITFSFVVHLYAVIY